MSTLSNIALPTPKDWQDFERKMQALFACVLDDPNTQMHGRTGQPQNGIDIWGFRNRDQNRLLGVQCKRSGDAITAAELDAELEKAKEFRPAISEFILVTTAPRDAKIQRKARELTESLVDTERPITVVVWGWDDIEEHAARHADAWKIFDPTYNPFAERAHKEVIAQLAALGDRLDGRKSAAPFILPQHETVNFTGREDELRALELALLGDHRNRVCTIQRSAGRWSHVVTTIVE